MTDAKKPFTFADRHAIEQGLAQGKTYEQIATEIGRSASGIKREVNRAGGKRHYESLMAQEFADARKRRVGGRRDWTEEEEHYMMSLLRDGKGPDTIANIMGVSYTTIATWVGRCGITQVFRRMEELEGRIQRLEEGQ